MRCISPYAGYSITVFEGRERIVVDASNYAKLVSLEKPIIAQFERSGLLDHEIEAALTTFTFSGLPEGVNPLTRVAVFDSEAYCARLPASERAETQIQVDQRLRELQEQHPTDYIIVEPLEIPKPWLTYDEQDVEEILKIQSAIGADPETVYRYELENQGRGEILEVMLRQYDPDQADAKFGAEEDEEPIVVQT